jgi:hypothetical protein
MNQAKDHIDKTISDKEIRKRLSILTSSVKKSTQKAKASLDKGIKDVEDVLPEIRRVKK